MFALPLTASLPSTLASHLFGRFSALSVPSPMSVVAMQASGGAAHVCWALLAGGQSAAVDDGEPSGTAGPYPYESDRPGSETLQKKAYYRVFFPNRKADMKTPIVDPNTESLELHIEGLGSEAVRVLQWDFPLDYPEVEQRRLPSEAVIRARKEAERAERAKARQEAEGK